MSTRAQRRDDARIEALVKGGLALVLLIALGIGGITGFARVLPALLFLLVVVAVLGGAGYLVLQSRLHLRTRIGLCLLLVSTFGVWLWWAIQPPATWPEVRATVRTVTSPPCVAETDYSFQAQGVTRTFKQTKNWPSVEAARRSPPPPLTVYFNPSRPTEMSEKPVNGWVRAQATSFATRTQEQGEYRATLSVGEGLLAVRSAMANVSGPVAATYKVGGSVNLWVNPLNAAEFSLKPRATVGGKNYPLLGGAILSALGGIILLFMSLRRRAEVSVPAATPAPSAAAPRPVMVPSPPPIRRQLESIDWYQFEKVSARILERSGWQVRRTGGAKPDGGADIVAERAGERAVVQCKFWKRTFITPKIVRELLGTKASAGFDAKVAILFSLSECTDEARRFAAENGILVYTSDLIVEQIGVIGLGNFPELLEPEKKLCPRCDAPMILRQSSTPFWGCSRFPTHGCRGKIETNSD